MRRTPRVVVALVCALVLGSATPAFGQDMPAPGITLTREVLALPGGGCRRVTWATVVATGETLFGRDDGPAPCPAGLPADPVSPPPSLCDTLAWTPAGLQCTRTAAGELLSLTLPPPTVVLALWPSLTIRSGERLLVRLEGATAPRAVAEGQNARLEGVLEPAGPVRLRFAPAPAVRLSERPVVVPLPVREEGDLRGEVIAPYRLRVRLTVGGQTVEAVEDARAIRDLPAALRLPPAEDARLLQAPVVRVRPLWENMAGETVQGISPPETPVVVLRRTDG